MEAETRDVVLTFKDGVQDSLLDLGFFCHIGSHLSEDELSWCRFKTVPVVFDNRHAVLKEQIAQISQIVLRLIQHPVLSIKLSPWCARYGWSGGPLCLFPVHLKTQHYLLSIKLLSKPRLFSTYWFWCPWKAERHSVGSSPFCPWRWSWQQTWAEAKHTYKMLVLKQSDNYFSECTVCTTHLPVFFSGVWCLWRTSSPWGGSEACATSLTSRGRRREMPWEWEYDTGVRFRVCLLSGLRCTSASTAGGDSQLVLSKTVFGRCLLSLFK